MKTKFWQLLIIPLLILTWSIRTYHIEVVGRPNITEGRVPHTPSVWIPKEKLGINQILLFGLPYHRGLEFGRLTQNLIYAEEKELISLFYSFFPNPLIRHFFILGAIRWFWGLEKHFSKDHLKEILGISEFATTKFNYLADPYTRQIAYHGIHDIGQFFMDYQRDDLGCTLLAYKNKDGWIVGRNFDFEAGRIFDEEKIMKWVFPKKGNAYLSITWAGMVGVVTGINQNGLYVSMNAAGSSDLTRYASPSTLLLTKVLQHANNIDDALAFFKNDKILITDIFTLIDQKTQKAYKIEKTPLRTIIKEHKSSFVVSNHLLSPNLKQDPINQNRIQELTTLHRYKRASQLINQFSSNKDAVSTMLASLRDKNNINNTRLHLGNRKAIDSLISSHSAIINFKTNTIYVSQGPALTGKYIGFDFAKSFQEKRPVKVGELPKDPTVSSSTFFQIKRSFKISTEAQNKISNNECESASRLIKKARQLFSNSSIFYKTLGNFQSRCKNNKLEAKISWKKALGLDPAYLKDRNYLRKKINE